MPNEKKTNPGADRSDQTDAGSSSSPAGSGEHAETWLGETYEAQGQAQPSERALEIKATLDADPIQTARRFRAQSKALAATYLARQHERWPLKR